MTVQKGLYLKNVFFILCGCAIINHGISQEDADYTAEVSISELKVKPNNGYFDLQGQLPKLILYTEKEIEASQKFYVLDYYIDKNEKKHKIGHVPLCDELPNRSSSELRDKVLFTFLFPGQRRCPIKMDKVREPESKILSFNYDASEVSCNAPWKYRQEIISLYNTKDPMINLTVSLKMEKKGECAS